MADVNTSHISNIENNRVKISLSTLVQICNALNTTVDYVISSEYISADTPLEQEILTALKPLPIDTKEKVLKIYPYPVNFFTFQQYLFCHLCICFL